MTIFQAVFLAIVQGLTEFLPISSSGHLVLFQKIFRISGPPVLFDVLLHLGTLSSILVFFWKDLFSLMVDWKKKKNIWLFLIFGSIPVAVLGFFLNKEIEKTFGSLKLVGWCWVVFGIILVVSQKIKIGNKDVSKASLLDALFVGLWQALALFPGVSRSGSTIIGGLWQKFSYETAFRLSFFLSIPAILGAVVLKFQDHYVNSVSIPVDIACMFLAAFVGYFSLKFLEKILKSDKFYYFGFYCLVLGFLVVVLV